MNVLNNKVRITLALLLFSSSLTLCLRPSIGTVQSCCSLSSRWAASAPATSLLLMGALTSDPGRRWGLIPHVCAQMWPTQALSLVNIVVVKQKRSKLSNQIYISPSSNRVQRRLVQQVIYVVVPTCILHECKEIWDKIKQILGWLLKIMNGGDLLTGMGGQIEG